MDKRKLYEYLKKEKEKEIKNSLRHDVLKYILEYYEDDEDIKGFLNDVLNYGCISGVVSNLVYYADTNKFYDEHEEEIEDLLNERMEGLSREDIIGKYNSITEEKKSFSLVWF